MHSSGKPVAPRAPQGCSGAPVIVLKLCHPLALNDHPPYGAPHPPINKPVESLAALDSASLVTSCYYTGGMSGMFIAIARLSVTQATSYRLV
jgi:hypothetical protein